jgi:hypothetical protein
MKTSLLSLSAAFVTIVAVTLAGTSARAEVAYAWCSITSLNLGTPDCSYSTIEQCRASIAGGGGYCQPNARAAPQAQMQRRGFR